MTPTPEQIAQWARESGALPYVNRHYPGHTFFTFSPEQLDRFAALVDAHRAEQDANHADYFANNSLAARTIAAAIRASVKE